MYTLSREILSFNAKNAVPLLSSSRFTYSIRVRIEAQNCAPVSSVR